MKDFGFIPADILLPRDADMTRWSCVACDQYTSEPDYWNAVETLVGGAPSTLRLMLPEIYLDQQPDRASKIPRTMRRYLETGVFREIKDSFVYVERVLESGQVRHGLVGAIDLEIYDYSKGTTSLCRPTEATVVSRLPARVRVRSEAAIEMPHIMMLLDDPQKTVIEPYGARKAELPLLYDFPLMQHSGSIRGYQVTGDKANAALSAIAALYDHAQDAHCMLYAMGDGNHSLAAAKLYYEQLKQTLGDAARQHPARYALVELVNLHDPSLVFEPIHRVLFDVDPQAFMRAFEGYAGLVRGKAEGKSFRVVTRDGEQVCTFTRPYSGVTVGMIQDFADDYIQKHGGKTDYIHGDDVVRSLANAPGRIGFIVDGIPKDSFFDVIRKDGILPRKTFSMGNAADKRFYLECRKIVQ